MSASIRQPKPRELKSRELKPREPKPRAVGEALVPAGPLTGLASLASLDIATSVVSSLHDELHTLFDPVSDGVLPIYFGPLLGRLYLEGL